jgi:hypothetical protein
MDTVVDVSDRAVDASVRAAGLHGYVVEDATVLQRTNNTVVWLRPHEIVAKVGTSPGGHAHLIREHEVAEVIAAKGAPIAAPIAGIYPIRDSKTGYIVTLWQRLENDPDYVIGEVEHALALRELHAYLAGYDRELPSFTARLALTHAALEDDPLATSLDPSVRSLLRETFARATNELVNFSYVERVLHGEPHDANLLATPTGLRWVDLEAVCVGPAEWDLAALPDGAHDLFPAIDTDLLRLLRTLTSAHVATWCSLRVGLPGMRWHAQHHLRLVREYMTN